MRTDTQPTLAITNSDIDACTNSEHLHCHGHTVTEAVIVTEDHQQVLLRKRTGPLFTSNYELPKQTTKPTGPHTGSQLDTQLHTAADKLLTHATNRTPDQNTHRLATTTSTTADPRHVHTTSSASCYVVPSDTTANDQYEWVPLQRLATGTHALAFGHASRLAEITAPDGPLNNPELHDAFTALTAASEIRNASIASRSNAIRLAIGADAVNVDWAKLSQAKDTLARLTTSGKATSRLEDRRIPLAQRRPVPTAR